MKVEGFLNNGLVDVIITKDNGDKLKLVCWYDSMGVLKVKVLSELRHDDLELLCNLKTQISQAVANILLLGAKYCVYATEEV